MNRILQPLTGVDNTLVRIEIWMAGSLAAAMVTVIFLQVIFRYALQNSLSWSEELGRYLFVWVSMMGASIAVQKKTHFGLELIQKALPQRMRNLLMIFISLCMLVFCIVLCIEGTIFVLNTFDHTSSAMDLPMPWIYTSLPIAGTLMTFHLLIAIIYFFSNKDGR